jgi:hypothetical protein
MPRDLVRRCAAFGATLTALTAAAACGADPTAPATAPAGAPAAVTAPDAARLVGPAGTATFVLASAGPLSEPVAKFDHICTQPPEWAAKRLLQVLHDTLTLNADGTARRGVALVSTYGGAPDPVGSIPSLVAEGTWAPAVWPDNWRDYGGKSGVTLWLSYPILTGGSASYRYDLVLDAAGRLTTRMAFGGACMGPERGGDSRHEWAVYTRR